MMLIYDGFSQLFHWVIDTLAFLPARSFAQWNALDMYEQRFKG